MSDVLLSIGGDVSALNSAIDNALSRPRSVKGINANTFTEPLGRITGKASEFSKSLEASNARVVAFGASAGAIFAVQKAFTGLVTATIDVEKSINGIGTILGTTSANLRGISNELFKVASLTGQSFSAAAEAAQEFARQGLNAEEMILRTRDALILARISGMDFANSAKAITTAINAFSSEMLTSTDIVNRLSAADTSFAVSSKDLADALSRVGSTAEDSNVSLNETISLVTAAAQITGRSGAVIGNAFKSMFTRLERPKVLDDLNDIGIKIRDMNGNILPTIDILRNLATTYDSLTPSQQSFASETVGSVYQINTLKAVLKDLGGSFSIYDSALKVVNNSTGSAIARNEQLNQTLSAKLLATMNSITQAGAKMGELVISPTLGPGAGLATGFFDGITKSLNAEHLGGDIARGIFKGIGNMLAGPGLQFVTFAMLKLFQNLSTFASKAVGEFTGVNTKSKQLEATQVQVLIELSKQPAVLAAIRAGTVSVDSAAKQVFNDIRAQNTALEAQLALARLIAGAGISKGLSVQGTTYKAATGYVPNFNDFAMEEAQAKSLGARNPRAHYGKGKIGGRPFIMNSEETEIPNFGSNGDSAVIPKYATGNNPTIKMSRRGLEQSLKKTIKHSEKADWFDKFSANLSTVPQKFSDSQFNNLTRGIVGRMVEHYSTSRGLKINSVYVKKWLGVMSSAGADPSKISTIDSAIKNLSVKDSAEERQNKYRNLLGQVKGVSGEVRAARLSGSRLRTGNDFVDLENGQEIKTKKTISQPEILAKYVNEYLSENDIKNRRANDVPFGNKQVIMPNDGRLVASGHFPNFAATMPVADAYFQFAQTPDFKRTRDHVSQEVPATGQFMKRLLGIGATNIRAKLTRNFSKGTSFPGYDSVVSAMVDGVLKKYLVSVKAGSARNHLADIAKINHQMALGLEEPEIQAIQGEIVKVLAMRDTPPSVSKAGKFLKSRSFANGFMPNFADLSFKKSSGEFGITKLSGYLGKSPVGDLEYSGKGVREIEGFDINEKHRGKGFAKQFYKAMGKGKTKGTLLPNYDENGQVYFPQLSRARSAKTASISQYGSTAQMTVAQFNDVIKKNASDKKFWDNNTFELMTSHANGYVPSFAPAGNVFDFDGTLGLAPKGNITTPDGQSRRMMQRDTYHGWSVPFMEPSPLAMRAMKNKTPLTVLTARSPESIPYIQAWLQKHGIPFERVVATGHKNYPEGVTETYQKKSYELNQMGARGKKFYEDDPRNLRSAWKSAGIKRRKVDFGNGGLGQHANGFVPSFSPWLRRLQTPEDEGFASLNNPNTRGGALRMMSAMGGVDEAVLDKPTPELVKHLMKTNPGLLKQLVKTGVISRSGSKAAGFIPNLASPDLIDRVFAAASKMPNGSSIIEKLKEGTGLKDESFMKAAQILGVPMETSKKASMPSMPSIDPLQEMVNNYTRRQQAKEARYGGPLTADERTNIAFVQGLFKKKFAKMGNIKTGAMGAETIDMRELVNDKDIGFKSLNFGLPHGDFLKQFQKTFVRMQQYGRRKGSTELFTGLFAAEFGLEDEFKEFSSSDRRQGSRDRYYGKRFDRYMKRGGFAGGFVPHFSAVQDAIDREMSAGYSRSQVRVGQDMSLKSAHNPNGVGIYNSTEGSLSNGISLAKKAGIDPKTKGMAKGHVPNFAEPGGSMGMGMMQFLLALPMVTASLEKFGKSSDLAGKRAEVASKRYEEALAKQKSLPAEKAAAQASITKARDSGAVAKANLTSLQSRLVTQQQNQSASTSMVDKVRIQRDIDATQKAIKAKKIDISNAATTEQEGGQKLKRLAGQEKYLPKFLEEQNTRVMGGLSKGQKAFGLHEGYRNSMAGKVQGMGMGVGMGIGVAGGMASEMVKRKDPKLGAALEDMTGGLTLAGQVLSTIPGPVGWVVAGAVAVGTAFNFVDKMLYGFSDELIKASDIKLKNLEKIDNASNELAKAMGTHSEVMRNSSSTAAQTRRAAANYNKALVKMAAAGDSQLMARLATATGSDEKQAILAEAQSKRADERAIIETQKGMAGTAEKLKIEDMGWWGTTKRAVFQDSFLGGPSNIFQSKHAAGGGGVDTLRSMGEQAVSSGNINKYISKMRESGVITGASVDTLADYSLSLKRMAKLQEAVNTEVDKRVGSIRAEQSALETLQTAMKESLKNLETFAGAMSLTQLKNIGDKIKGSAKAEQGDAQILAARNSGSGFAPGGFISQSGAALTGVRNSMDLVGSSIKLSFAEAEGNLVDALSNIAVGDGSFKKLGDGGGPASLKGYTNSSRIAQEIFSSFSKEGKFKGNNIQGVTSDLKSTIMARAQSIEYNGGDKSAAAMLRTMALNLDTSKVQVAINQANKELQSKGLEALQQLGTTSIESKNKLQDLINQKQLQVGGGLSSFMQDFGAGRQQESRKAIAEASSRIPEVAARGSINFLKNATQDLGLGSDDKRLAPLMAKAIAGVEAGIIKSQQSLGMGVDRGLARSAATKQVREAVETDSLEKIGQNQTAAINKTNEILTVIANRTGVRLTQDQLTSGQGLKAFNNTFDSREKLNQKTATDEAAGRIQAMTASIAHVARALDRIQVKIQQEYNLVIKNTKAGDNLTKLEQRVEGIIAEMEKNGKITPPKATGK